MQTFWYFKIKSEYHLVLDPSSPELMSLVEGVFKYIPDDGRVWHPLNLRERADSSVEGSVCGRDDVHGFSLDLGVWEKHFYSTWNIRGIMNYESYLKNILQKCHITSFQNKNLFLITLFQLLFCFLFRLFHFFSIGNVIGLNDTCTFNSWYY